ncbi:MAG: hypothetical protein IPQ07_14915 [Myxococcales bacterium]|nr:hypothetical protein [Myxococcales bacterium]
MAEPVPDRIGDYLIERLLGEGGMAKVYLARHSILETRHAIKVLDPPIAPSPRCASGFSTRRESRPVSSTTPTSWKVVNIVATPDRGGTRATS